MAVFALNMTYDVPVKLLSFHLMMMSVVLVVAKNGPKMQRADPDEKMCCSIRNNEITSHKMSMKMFGDFLGGNLDRLVLDETGLTGEYRFKLTYAPDTTPQRNPDDPAPPPDLASGSVFAAIQERLGLKLESRKDSLRCL